MSFLLSDSLPIWIMPLSVAGHLAAGIALGILYFRSLWWTTSRLGAGRRVMPTVALIIGRFMLLGGALALASLEGALALLVMALGVLIARAPVVRGVREAAP